MSGRFSAEKAKQIKEARELAAEIEAAKEFNNQFGAKEDGGRVRTMTMTMGRSLM